MKLADLLHNIYKKLADLLHNIYIAEPQQDSDHAWDPYKDHLEN